MSRRPLLCLDTASLYYRSYYALPESMTAPDGHPHQAVRGFLSTLTRLVTTHGPRAIAACWDADWRPAWRVEALPSYKTHRLADDDPDGGESEPDTLGPQIGAIAQILDALGIPRPGAAAFEADDIIATLAAREPEPTIVVTGDRDLVQVVRPGVDVLLTVNGGMERWPVLDGTAVLERFGVAPDQYVDLAVLRGDPSDGIPGVPGVGAKTAAALLQAFGSIDTLLDRATDETPQRPLTPRLAGLLEEHRSAIAAMRAVATARLDAPVPSPAPVIDLIADEPRLAEVSAEWGVQRFVDELRAALRQTVDA